MLLGCWICEESPNPAKKGRENELITLAADWPRMVTSWICEESPNPAKKEDELLYFRGQAALVFVLDL